MAVAIKKKGFTSIILYNGGLKDWIKAGHKTVSVAPLPRAAVHFIDVDSLHSHLLEAEANNCVDNNGEPLLTIVDFRMSHTLQKQMSGDKYQIKTSCQLIKAQLDDFLDNMDLINTLPDSGQIISISETGNRDHFLIQYLAQFNKTNIKGLKYGMRNWLKAGYPSELIPQDQLKASGSEQ